MAILTSRKVRFSVDEYFRMSDAGVFDDRRVELLDGRIVEMHAQSDPHMIAITKIGIVLSRHFGDTSKFWIISQGRYVIEPFDAPDPDFHIVDVPLATPAAKRPRPFLVIEAAVTTYRRDAGIKLRRYAEAGVKDYWIANIPEKRFEVYRNPINLTGRKRDWKYRDVKHFGLNATIKPLAYPKASCPVHEMLP